MKYFIGIFLVTITSCLSKKTNQLVHYHPVPCFEFTELYKDMVKLPDTLQRGKVDGRVRLIFHYDTMGVVFYVQIKQLILKKKQGISLVNYVGDTVKYNHRISYPNDVAKFENFFQRYKDSLIVGNYKKCDIDKRLFITEIDITSE